MNYKLELTPNELNIILAALSRMPYEQVVSIIDKLVKEINTQTKEGN